MTHLYRIFEFLRTPLGKACGAIALILTLIVLAPSCDSNVAPKSPPTSYSSSGASNVQISLSRPRVPAVATPPMRKTEPKPTVPVVYTVHVDLPDDTNTVRAPFGRLIQCQLVNTLESHIPGTPIVGLVTEDLYHNGELIIPAGSEIHGQASFDRSRERVTSTGPWRIVLKIGETLTVSGVALDREYDPDGEGWGITDGSLGIPGDVLRSDSLQEVKLFLATAVSGVAAGFRQTRETPFGSRLRGTARNAALNGTSEVMNAYAQQILEAIKRDGVFVRVVAGSQFYVYVTEPIVEPASLARPSEH